MTSPRTPPPGPIPILRLTTCSTSTTASKKHVVILEPNRTELPSARRQLFRRSAPPRLETVRIRAPRIDSDDDDYDGVGVGTYSEGDVSGQWDSLCQAALVEAEKVVDSLNLTCLEIGTLVGGVSDKDREMPILDSSQTLAIIFATSNLNLMQVRSPSSLNRTRTYMSFWCKFTLRLQSYHQIGLEKSHDYFTPL